MLLSARLLAFLRFGGFLASSCAGGGKPVWYFLKRPLSPPRGVHEHVARDLIVLEPLLAKLGFMETSTPRASLHSYITGTGVEDKNVPPRANAAVDWPAPFQLRNIGYAGYGILSRVSIYLLIRPQMWDIGYSPTSVCAYPPLQPEILWDIPPARQYLSIYLPQPPPPPPSLPSHPYLPTSGYGICLLRVSIYLSIYLSIYISIYLSIYLSHPPPSPPSRR